MNAINTIPGFTKLHETDKFVLGHLHENAYLVEKTTGTQHDLGDFYGDPVCGLISTDHNWCIISGGEKFVLWTPQSVTIIENIQLHNAFKIRQINPGNVQILIDPWVENAAVLELNIETRQVTKLRDFPNYKNKPFTENVAW